MSDTDHDSYPAPPPEETHLWDYVHALLRRRRPVLAVFLAVAVLATVRTLLMEPVYEGTAQILIERDDPNVLSFQEISQVDAGKDDYYQTQYKLLESRSLARRVIERLNLLNDPEYGGPREADHVKVLLGQPPGEDRELEREITHFLDRLAVRPVRNSRLVNVSVTSLRPELAARQANTLASLYIQQSLDLRFQTSSEAGQWLGTQIAEQQARVEALDQQLQDLKREQGLVNIDERRTLLDQRLKELGTALNERKTERLQKEALWRQMSSTRNPEELLEVIGSPLVQSLRIELANLERQEAQLLERYLGQHPEVVQVRNQIRDTKTKIGGEAQRIIHATENDYKTAAAQEASVSAALEATKAEALDLGARAVTHDARKREVEAAQQVLDSLMARAKETDVASELKSTNIRVVDQAVVPERPIRPRKLRDIALGLLLGAFLGVPLLGVIPENAAKSESDRVVRDPSAEGPFAEGYRVIRTALLYCWPDAGPRILVVTSTSPGEGKTLTAVNLALTLASGEGKVLLVDADLRKSHTHALLRAKRSPGLSDVIVGRARPSEAIQRNLHGTTLAYLPAGSNAPSPADLLTNHTMRSFLDGLRGFYDWIVVDTPPVGAVAEPLILAPLADGVVLVGGAEMVPRKAVLHTLERLHETGARTLGLVLNRAQVERHSYYYGHYYGHYYGKYPRKKDLDRTHPKVTPIASRRRA